MDKIEVEVTVELMDFVSNQLDMRCHRVDLYGREYLKVYGDIYRDLSRLKYKWQSHRPNAPILDFCNISSQGNWLCSVVTNWDELNIDTQRRIMSNN